MSARPTTGRVYLVGAGPGDPELLTLRAVRLLQQTDVIVYDHLVSSAVLDFVSPSAERIYAGKRRNEHTMRQEQINALLIKLAQQGKQVVRLKGGDPFIFGRGGEEMEALQAAGVRVQVINGITAGMAAVTSLGVPLTHREHAHGVVFATGHAKPGSAGTDWRALAATARQARLTLVIYMGVSGAATIQRELLYGLHADTPVAIIQNASLSTQRHAVCLLAELESTIRHEQLASPSVIVVGDVLQGLLAAGLDTAATANPSFRVA